VARDEVRHRRRHAAIGHVVEAQPGAQREQLRHEVIDAAGAGGAEIHLAGLAFGMRDQRRPRRAAGKSGWSG
jgi:hypothetical protein